MGHELVLQCSVPGHMRTGIRAKFVNRGVKILVIVRNWAAHIRLTNCQRKLPNLLQEPILAAWVLDIGGGRGVEGPSELNP